MTVNELCDRGDVSEVRAWLCTQGNLLTDESVLTLSSFINSQSDADVVKLWGSLQRQTHNVILAHPHVVDRVVAAARVLFST